ncbi:FAD/NAD P-binding domain-containing protein [Gloeophyllum trabeum ATCC 11539]|uniref:FAD/NAD P-binding domain-containing protein n=1 Tax=Gloeophyllum trabeum (strain ATCC 11539 / FP-39264 / Madison 617) TaxID=670483 RepID=S7QLX9_GLOTA|nr:FAD/NAD P-binding domain-containing protein [Gloeophyllum trabeum ATCC 11539]EPQ60566.1 FAD/NAD P-binding domain-containing protein [Gloeophyllum trabeum ATCC 11539]
MSVANASLSIVQEYISTSQKLAKQGRILPLVSPWRAYQVILQLIYIWLQGIIILLFKPTPPKSPDQPTKPLGRVAVVGAGLTGISSAAHAIAHGFDVVIYEAGDRPGGIWAHVNSTSGLQLNSLIYRFHPAVLWRHAFPKRDEVLSEIRRIWKEYQLEPRTRFNTRVTSVTRSPADFVEAEDLDPKNSGHARWIINDGSDGPFDAVIVTIGTCGKPQKVGFPGMPDSEESGDNRSDKSDQKREGKEDEHEGETFQGQVIHSSELDEADLEGKTVLVIGSGASGVEAVETALSKGARDTLMVARDDKWIIPRNIVFDTTLSAQPFGRETPLSFIWEWVLKKWHYRGVEDIAPHHRGIFEGTPVVNDEFLNYIRTGRCTYVRGDTLRLTNSGILVNVRSRESKPKDPGEKKEFKGDVVVLATGFQRPEIDFLPEDLFPENYQRPDLYLQNFPTEDWSILLTNSAYVNAIGTVGHFHIGIYTRILLTLLLDKDARPAPKDMKLWVDNVRFVKRGAKGGPLSFFTYMELTIWLLLFHLFRPDRIRWLFFIMQGWGVVPQEYRQ